MKTSESIGDRKARRGKAAGHSARERGVALILVILAMTVLSVLAAAIVCTVQADTLASYNYKLTTQADYLAEAGIQQPVNWFCSSRCQAVSRSQAPTYYNVSTTGAAHRLHTSNTSPVRCIASSPNCPTRNQPVQLIGIPGTGSSNYPDIANASGVPVASAFTQDLVNVRLSGDASNSGTFSIDAVLVNCQPLNSGNPPTATPIPVATWLITSGRSWTGRLNPHHASAEEQVLIQPIYFPSCGHGLYGYCWVTTQGSAGVRTDTFSSALGAYADGNVRVAAGQCGSTTATNVIAAGAGPGANGGVILGSNVVVSANVRIGTNPTPGCSASGFTGNTSLVLGQVLNGPQVDPPSVPTFPSGFLSGAPIYLLTGGALTQTVPAGAPANPAFGYPGTAPGLDRAWAA